MLFAGYSGVGKTTLCKQTDGIDLDSSIFIKEKGWEGHYIATASKLMIDGRHVFISAHREVIEWLLKYELDFVLIIPDGDKMEWISRLMFRYSQNRTDGNLKALMDCINNFDKDMSFYRSINCKKIFVKAKPIQTDIKEKILSLHL